MVVAVQVPGRVLHQQPHHLRFGLQLGQRPLHSLVDRQRLAEHLTLAGVFGRTVNTVLRRAEAAGCLPNSVLVQERLGNLQPAIHFTEYRVGRHADIIELDFAVVGGHVERPPVVGDGKALRLGGHQERGDAPGLSRLAGCAGEDQVVGGAVDAGVEPLGTVDHPLIAVGFCMRFEPGRIRAVLGLGEPEGHRAFSGDQRLRPGGALRIGAEPFHHDHLREVADDR